MNEFDRVKNRRKQFLRAAYDLGKNQPLRIARLEDIAQKLGLDASDPANIDELTDIADYYGKRGAIKSQADGYTLLSINSLGIDIVEGNFDRPRTWGEVQYGPLEERSNTDTVTADAPVEIQDSLKRFREDYPDPKTTAFIMMRFRDTPEHNAIATAVKEALAAHGITGVRADERSYHTILFYNIETYLHGCSLGVAVFESIEATEFNPNVSLEVGYMFAMKKPVCLLKDKTIKTLPSDLVGHLYEPFDSYNPATTISPRISRWLSDRGITETS